MEERDIEEQRTHVARAELHQARAGVIAILVPYTAITAFAVLTLFVLGPLAFYLVRDNFSGFILIPSLALVIPGAVALLLGLKEAFRNLTRNKATDAPVEMRHLYLIAGTAIFCTPVSFMAFFIHWGIGIPSVIITLVSAGLNIHFARANSQLRLLQLALGILLPLAFIMLLAYGILYSPRSPVSEAAFTAVVIIAVLAVSAASIFAAWRWLLVSWEYLITAAIALLAAACAITVVSVLAFAAPDPFFFGSDGSDFFWWILAVAALLLPYLGLMLLPFLLKASASYARLLRGRLAARAVE